MDRLRDKIAHFIATSKVKKKIEEGVTDDNFFDYSFYVDLVAKSLRRFADDRHSYTPMGWRLDSEISSREELEAIAGSHTDLLHRWADILSIRDSDLMDEPYYKPYWDHISSSTTRPARFDKNGKPVSYYMEWPESTEEVDQIKSHLASHEAAIHNLQIDILVELAENHRYLWD